MKIEIKNRYTNTIILCGEYENIKDCLEKNSGAYLEGANLRDAYLVGANLRDAYLVGANLGGANLEGANLEGAKEYFNSHDFWLEIIKRQSIKTFIQKEWAIIGQIFCHRLCWNSIKKRYGKTAMPIFKKLAKAGFDEWQIKYTEVSK